MVPAVLPGSLASNGASNAAARKYCRAHRIAWPSPCKPLAWSLTGHLWCSVAKLLMIIPGCYSRVSWVLSSDSDSFPGPGQDPYRRRFPLQRRLIRNGSHPVHSLLTSHIRGDTDWGGGEALPRVGLWPGFYGASESNGSEAYLSAKTRDPIRWPEGARGPVGGARLRRSLLGHIRWAGGALGRPAGARLRRAGRGRFWSAFAGPRRAGLVG